MNKFQMIGYRHDTRFPRHNIETSVEQKRGKIQRLENVTKTEDRIANGGTPVCEDEAKY